MKETHPLFPGLMVLVCVFVWYSGFSWVWVVVGLVAFLLNGFVATLEDDLPGGFNNPDGTATPSYVNKVKRIFKLGVGVACSMIAAVIVVSAMQGAMDLITGILFAVVPLSLGCGLIWPTRKVQSVSLLIAIIVFGCAVWRLGVA